MSTTTLPHALISSAFVVKIGIRDVSDDEMPAITSALAEAVMPGYPGVNHEEDDNGVIWFYYLTNAPSIDVAYSRLVSILNDIGLNWDRTVESAE